MASRKWNPYRCGNIITVTSHNPPPLSKRPPDALSSRVFDELRTKTPLDRAVRRNRVEGPAVLNPRQFSLEISKGLCVGPGKAAQVVVVTSEAIHNNQPVVAKFYDCAFADHEHVDVDPTQNIERQYISETEAYAKLRPLWGTVVPRYFGSYTVDFTTRLGINTVRLILLQHITGMTLSEYDTWTQGSTGEYSCQVSLTQRARKNLLQKLILADAYARECGVDHRDVALRNAILHTGGPEDVDANVMLIDFGESVCFEPKEGEDLRNGRLVFPVEEWKPQREKSWGVDHWVDWDWNMWIRNWLEDYKDRFSLPSW